MKCVDALFLRVGLMRCRAVCFVLIALPRFDCNVSIDTDTSVAGWGGRLSSDRASPLS